MDGQTENPVSFGDPATEPVDLAQAFKMYNQADRAPAAVPVEETGSDEAEGGELGSVDDRVSGDGGSSDSGEDATPGGAEGSEMPGGSADVIEPIDFNARKQQILKEIQQDALASVRKDFADNNIALCSIEELYNRDENTGRVSFKNPDDPTRDFQSRAEAQAWVDAFNKQVEAKFRQDVNKRQRELVTERAPMMRLIEFAPKFQALDSLTKDVLDDLIEPYTVRDSNGNPIGYSCNLDAALAQAQRITKRFSAKPEAQNPAAKAEPDVQKRAERPAMNMPTGSGKSADEEEPKTIGEALARYDKMQREKGKKK